jgi:predicted N-acetyltransferase YhbS
MTLVIRPAEEGDLSQILDLLSQLPIEPTLARPETHGAKEVMSQILAVPGRTMMVAEDGDDIVGAVDLVTVPNLTHRGAPWAIIENLIVDQKRRRKGIGRALMDEAIKRARIAGCYKIQLLSNTARRDAHHFYESLGFEQSAAGFRLYFDNADST